MFKKVIKHALITQRPISRFISYGNHVISKYDKLGTDYPSICQLFNSWEIDHVNTTFLCPLCSSSDTHSFHKDKRGKKCSRIYYQCHECELTFVPPNMWLSDVEERKRYDVHENNSEDDHYITFLRKSIDVLVAYHIIHTSHFDLELNSLKFSTPGPLRAIDFGCGPGPASSQILKSYQNKPQWCNDVIDLIYKIQDQNLIKNITTSNTNHISNMSREQISQYITDISRQIISIDYDPFFQNSVIIPSDWNSVNSSIFNIKEKCNTGNEDISNEDMQLSQLKGQCDLLICTEVIEHACDPHLLLSNLIYLLSENGSLVLSTSMAPTLDKFPAWGYRNDLTHICFFREKTFEWIKQHFNVEVWVVTHHVMILRKLSTKKLV